MRIRHEEEFDLTAAQRQVVRAMYRSLSYFEGREVARWEATKLAWRLQRMRHRLFEIQDCRRLYWSAQ